MTSGLYCPAGCASCVWYGIKESCAALGFSVSWWSL